MPKVRDATNVNCTKIHSKLTTYGFEFGAATVTRLLHDDKKGWVAIQVSSPKASWTVYVTKTGKMRLFEGVEERIWPK